jgi:4-carboxymuconolactone decarboxylase
MNVYSTVVRHPRLLRHWLPFGGALMTGKLTPRHRELLVLRTGWRCGSEYEWGQHALVAHSAGLTQAEIRRTQGSIEEAEWSPTDVLFLRVADEIHDDGTISDDAWGALRRILSDEQLIEIPMLVGHYHMVAFLLNALRVQRDNGVPGFEF